MRDVDISDETTRGQIAQVSGSYGRAEAETVVENCANALILRCSAFDLGGTALSTQSSSAGAR